MVAHLGDLPEVPQGGCAVFRVGWVDNARKAGDHVLGAHWPAVREPHVIAELDRPDCGVVIRCGRSRQHRQELILVVVVQQSAIEVHRACDITQVRRNRPVEGVGRSTPDETHAQFAASDGSGEVELRSSRGTSGTGGEQGYGAKSDSAAQNRPPADPQGGSLALRWLLSDDRPSSPGTKLVTQPLDASSRYSAVAHTATVVEWRSESATFRMPAVCPISRRLRVPIARRSGVKVARIARVCPWRATAEWLRRTGRTSYLVDSGVNFAKHH